MRKKHLTRCLVAMAIICLLLTSLPWICATDKSDSATDKTNANIDNRFNVVIVLDASGSMQRTDRNDYRFGAINQFTNLLAEKGNVLGAVVFHTDIAAEHVPATIHSQDGKDAVTNLLASVPDNGAWTNIGAGLSRAVELLVENGDPNLPSVILFLSDGNTDMADDEKLQASLDQKAEAIQAAREADIKIYSVCLNADKSADISEMQQISNATGGEFREVNDAEDLREVFNALYELIYSTSTITLADDVFPSHGRLEIEFEVPGMGVEEVNIIIYGNATKSSLVRPDSKEVETNSIDMGSFSMLKLTDVLPGPWTLITEGVPGDSIKINMVYNTDLQVYGAISTDIPVVTSDQEVSITATLAGGSVQATDMSQYAGYHAQLIIMDGYGDPLETRPMNLREQGFILTDTFAEGTYYFKVQVSGNYIEKESDLFGPMNVIKPSTDDTRVEEVIHNTAPTPVKSEVHASVNVWPFLGGSYELDLNTLATDEQDETLRYKVVSSSFLEGEDYTVTEDSHLKMEHFSLSKGSFTIRATDSGGLFCEIEVFVRAYNIGMIMFIAVCVIALIVLCIIGGVIFYMSRKPFRGCITAQSYCNGMYKGGSKNPRRGRCKLAAFGMDAVGLDYQKSYFQATAQNYIFLITNKPVMYCGKKVNKIRISSGAEVSVQIQEGDPRMLYLRFDSRMRNTRGRSGRGRGR